MLIGKRSGDTSTKKLNKKYDGGQLGKLIFLPLPMGPASSHDLPSIVSAQTNQHDADLSDGALGLEFHIGFDRNDHVAVHKGALISESQKYSTSR